MWWGRDGKRWTDADRLLTLALTSFEESLCPGCGQPKHVVYNPDAEGWFEVHEITCAGCKAQQEHAEQQKAPAAGAKSYVVDGRPDGLELRPWRLPSAAEPADHLADGV